MSEVSKLLVVGSGGRETAIIGEAMAEGVGTVYSTRGEDAVNFGIENVINTGLGEKDINGIASFADQAGVDLVIVGPEAPLVAGLADRLRWRDVPVFGPGEDGAVFEADKVQTHFFVDRHDGLRNPPHSMPFSPRYAAAARALIRELGPENVFTKRVGLEGGKGAKPHEGEDALSSAYREVNAVADKDEYLLVQGRLTGEEYSAMFMLDGQGGVVALPLARDHKQIYDGGRGPNTGGMGAYAPLSREHATVSRRMKIQAIGEAAAEGLSRDGTDYRGALYVGLMAENPSPDSDLSVIEFNVRFGDPETQAQLRGLEGSLIECAYACARGSVSSDMSRLFTEAGTDTVSLTVCLAAPGYPDGDVKKGLPIHLPKDFPDNLSLQFAGAKMVDGKPVSSGGRVLYATMTAPTLDEARQVYDHIGYDNSGIYLGNDEQQIRTDIGRV